jgi:putative sterol carrier protein
VSEYPKLKKLFPRKIDAAEVRVADLAESVESGAKLLKRGKDVGQLELRLVSSKGSRPYTVDVLAGDSRVTQGEADQPNLQVVVSEETWVEIANGDLSPVDAYLTGRMEVTGDLDFAKRQYAKAMSRSATEDLPF